MALGKVVCYLLSSPQTACLILETSFGTFISWDAGNRRQAANWDHSIPCGLGWHEGLSMTALLCVYTWRDTCVLPVSQLGTRLKPGQRSRRETRQWGSIPDPPPEWSSPSPPSALNFGPADIHSNHSPGFSGQCVSGTTWFPPPNYRTSPELPDERQETATYLI